MKFDKKRHRSLEKELAKAKRSVKIGGIYQHYKRKDNYKVIALGVQNSTEKICVVYRAEYNKKLIFVRDLESWLERPKGSDRFKRVK